MKPITRITFLLLLFAATLATAAFVLLPEIAKREDIVRIIDSTIEQDLECNAEIKQIKWIWFPLPGIQVEGIRISRDDFSLNATETSLFPDWLSLASGSPRISSITVNNPEIVISQIAHHSEEPVDLSALPRQIIINNGTLTVAPGIKIPGLLLEGMCTKFKKFNSIISFDKDAGTVSITGSFHPPYSAEVQLYARTKTPFETTSLPKSFAARLKVIDLDLNNLFQKWTLHHNAPTARKVNLAISIEGSENSTIAGSLTASSPCITLPGHKKGLDLSCGVVNADFKWSDNRLLSTIHKFIFENPAIQMAGTISLTLPQEHGNTPVYQGREPYWDINLKAKDIDLAGVRQVVLNLFGKQEIAREVCDIVRGGKATELTYHFQGSTSDFEFVDHMRLTALVDRAPIYIPEPDLFLDQASGPIRIEDGILYGENLTAAMGRSTGWNGSLVLGLSEHLFQFELDLDLDADLAELKPLLARLIDNQLVVDEVKKFHKISGRAQGSLRIGHDLRDFDVYVKIRDASGNAFYERLGWPVSIKAGTADIGPESVSWKGVTGTAGKSLIGECSGNYNWKGEEILTLNSLSATLDANETLAYLQKFPVLEQEIAPAVTALSGRVTVDSAWLQGPACKPENWKYRVPFSPGRLDISSPMLSGRWQAVSGHAVLTEKRLTTKNLALNIGSEKTVLNSSLSHRYLKEWQGKVSIKGTYGKTFQDWLSTRGWLPAPYRLSVPCDLTGLDIDFSDSALLLDGKCVFNNNEGSRQILDIALSIKEQGFTMDKLEIKDSGNSAVLSLRLPTASSPFSLQWKGDLDRSTLDAILEKNQLLQGFIKGNFSLLFPSSEDEYPELKGVIDLQGLNWPWGLEQPITISSLKYMEKGATGEMELMDIQINDDRLELHGNILPEKNGIRLDLSLDAPVLHKKNIQHILPDDNEKSSPGRPEKAQKSLPSSNESGHKPEKNHAESNFARKAGKPEPPSEVHKIYGTIKFSVGTYFDDPVMKANEIIPEIPVRQVAEYSDLEGELMLAPDGGMIIMVNHGNRCGIDFSGNATIDTDGHQIKSLLFHSPEDSEIRIEDILSCIGTETTIIQGAVSLEAYILLDEDELADGYLDLKAHDGKIRRMSLLSSIFSVINLVDLLGPDGWSEITRGGLAFSRAEMTSTIKDNVLTIDNVSIYGNGLNLFGTGKIFLSEKTVDATAIVSPLKTIDAIVTKIPLLGTGLGGAHKSFISFPVRIHGPLNNPSITPLPVKTITDILRKIIMSPIQAPLEMINNDKKDKKRQRGMPVARMNRNHPVKVETAPLKTYKRRLNPDE